MVRVRKNFGINIYLFIVKELRWGIYYICKRHSEANNAYMKNYDPKKPLKFISDLDMNNLYGWGISKFLPYRRSKWLKNVDNFDVNSISENDSIGYILEVDLKYLDELHQLHNDYPLAPEKVAIHYDMLSDYFKKIADKYGIKVGGVKNLIPNLGDKTNYVVHYRNFQSYLSLGIKLTKIHKVLKLKQSDWMKICIDFNTKKRKKCCY